MDKLDTHTIIAICLYTVAVLAIVGICSWNFVCEKLRSLIRRDRSSETR